MPYDEVMDKQKKGQLHSGSPSGPIVKNHDQAVAIMLNEKRKAMQGKKEYQSKKPGTAAPAHGGGMGERMARLARGGK